MSAIRPAATVVLLRERAGELETLLLRRSAAVQFAGGLWVFPGGRIDEADFAGDPDDIMAAAKRAAIRETREETGLIIDDYELQFFAHWTTPEHEPKRYATWFFAAALGSYEGDVLVDGGEIETHVWISPAQALARHRHGELDMLPPTFIALSELATCHSAQDVAAMYRDRPVVEILPKFIVTEQGPVALYPPDSGYETGNPDLPGRRHRTRRKKDGWYYECD